MSNKAKGDNFENYVKQVYLFLYDPYFQSSQIELKHNITLKDNNGVQCQFDLYWEQSIPNLTKYAIECKDFTDKVSVKHLRDFHMKCIDCNISKGIFISRNGFQAGAVEFAKSKEIDILTIKTFTEYKKTSNLITGFKGKTIVKNKVINDINIRFEISKDNLPDWHTELEGELELVIPKFNISIYNSSNIKIVNKNFKDYLDSILDKNTNEIKVNFKHNKEKAFLYKYTQQEQVGLNEIIMSYSYQEVENTSEWGYSLYDDVYAVLQDIAKQSKPIMVLKPN